MPARTRTLTSVRSGQNSRARFPGGIAEPVPGAAEQREQIGPELTGEIVVDDGEVELVGRRELDEGAAVGLADDEGLPVNRSRNGTGPEPERPG